MHINERLKLLRTSLGLSQELFGEKIGIRSRAHISSLENGKRVLTDRIINDLCREFEINEEWLRDGMGEMFKEEDEDDTFSLDAYLQENSCSEKEMIIIKSFLKAYMKFPVELRDSFINQVIYDFKKDMNKPDIMLPDNNYKIFIESMYPGTTEEIIHELPETKETNKIK